MKAAVYHEYGPPEVLRIEDVPKPVPKENEVLVRVHATSVCAADWRLRKADPFFIRFMSGLLRPTKMNILGMEFSGVVESVGAQVTKFHPGDVVFGGSFSSRDSPASRSPSPHSESMASFLTRSRGELRRSESGWPSAPRRAKWSG